MGLLETIQVFVRRRGAATLIRRIAAIVVTILAAGVAAAVPANIAHAAATASYINCQAADGGDGSATRPWNSLTAASAAELAPGDQLLFARGSTCHGMLTVQGSGTSADRGVVGAYGTGALPRIIGTQTVAMLVENASDITVQDLSISNPGKRGPKRVGLQVLANNELVQGVIVQRLEVHDVDGYQLTDPGSVFSSEGGAIRFNVEGNHGRFNGVTITHNTVRHIDGEGVILWGTQDSGLFDRPAASKPWPQASTGVVIRDNSISDIAKNGIISFATVGALIEGNTVNHASQRSAGGTHPVCTIGIWVQFANSSTIQYNLVKHMKPGCDSEAFDIDNAQDRVTVQYNVSEDNPAGFILLCRSSQKYHHAVVRYNLSINDGSLFGEDPCGDQGPIRTITLHDIRVYNNTFIAPEPWVKVAGQRDTSWPFYAANFLFKNNIVDATKRTSQKFVCGGRCSNNLFYGIRPGGKHAVIGKPHLRHPTGEGGDPLSIARGFRLRPKSPAIGAGGRIGHAGTHDFFGNPLPSKAPPTIGFSQPTS